MITKSTKWMAAISILFFAFALGMMFEAKTSRGSASELASPRGPAIVSSAPVLQGGAGTAFTYQGRLEDAGGPAEGTHDFLFRLFDAPVDGGQVGETLCADDITVSDGLFTVQLDFGQQYATPDQRHLEIEVRRDSGLDCTDEAGFVVLSPRQQLTATPLASHANAAFALDAPDGSPTSAVFVDNDGRAGIGTLSPGNRLHVVAGETGDGVRLSGTGANDPAYHLYHSTIERGSLGLALRDGSWSTSARTGDVVLRTREGRLLLQNGFLEAGLTINNNNVGIGTTAPREELEVHGDIRLGPSGQFRATSGEENLRIVRGIVSATGGILAGSGFTVSHPATGRYTITFNTPFAGPPTVTGTAESEFTNRTSSFMTDGVFTNRANIELRTNDTFLRDFAFHFTAVGPR